MKKIKIILILLVLLAVLLSGCKEGEVQEVSKSPYLEGTKGIVAEFMDMGIFNDETKINEIYEDETFPIEVIIKNKGENEINPGDITVTLKGIYLGSFSGIVPQGELINKETIDMISEINEDGGEEIMDFTPGTDDAKYTTAFSGTSVDLDLFAEIVFKYKTEATAKKICFKEDLQDDSICEVSESKDVFSSGAPIKVNHAKESTAGSAKIAVEFEVENVGGGDVAIIGESFDTRYNKFAFTSSSDSKWECRAAGKLNEGRFDSAGKAKISCKLKEAMPEDTLYTEDLSLTLQYKYRYLIQESVRIKKE